MVQLIISNMSTIIIALIIAGLAFLAARRIWRDKKAGKSCGCGSCSGCSGCSAYHNKNCS